METTQCGKSEVREAGGTGRGPSPGRAAPGHRGSPAFPATGSLAHHPSALGPEHLHGQRPTSAQGPARQMGVLAPS